MIGDTLLAPCKVRGTANEVSDTPISAWLSLVQTNVIGPPASHVLVPETTATFICSSHLFCFIIVLCQSLAGAPLSFMLPVMLLVIFFCAGRHYELPVSLNLGSVNYTSSGEIWLTAGHI